MTYNDDKKFLSDQQHQEILDGNANHLAEMRLKVERIDNSIKSLSLELEKNALYQEITALKTELKQLQQETTQAAETLSKNYIAAYLAAGKDKRVHPSAEVKYMKVADYVQNNIISWVFDHNMRDLVTLDTRAFNELVKDASSNTMMALGLDKYVTVNNESEKVYIKSDLSKFIAKKTQAQDDADA